MPNKTGITFRIGKRWEIPGAQIIRPAIHPRNYFRAVLYAQHGMGKVEIPKEVRLFSCKHLDL